METERIIPGTPILFVDERTALKSDRLLMSETDAEYAPTAVHSLNFILRTVPGVLIVVITSRPAGETIRSDIENGLKAAGFTGEVYDCISRFECVGAPPMKYGRLVDTWLDKRFEDDEPVNIAVCSERAELVWYRAGRWVPVNGYYGMLAVQAQMIIDILTGSQENL